MELHADSALVLIDIQRDFLPSGAQTVPRADEIVGPASELAAGFAAHNLRVVLTRDWHPSNHKSFRDQGGPYLPHCVQDTHGAEFADDLEIPEEAWIISKATSPDDDSVSAFGRTDLGEKLKAAGIRTLYIAGLTTDRSVKQTVLDGLAAGFEVVLIANACRGSTGQASTSAAAVEEMMRAGARVASSGAMQDALDAYAATP
jgi:nicotinamidase/pyrazinamidase